MASIKLFTDQTTFKYNNKRKLYSWLKNVIDIENKRLGELNIILTNDVVILEINKEHLNHNYYTDIITFNYNEGDVLKGELYISVETVNTNSIKFKTDFTEELHRVIVHGVLHLIGYNDKTKEQKIKMREKEQEKLLLWKSF